MLTVPEMGLQGLYIKARGPSSTAGFLLCGCGHRLWNHIQWLCLQLC
uniref:Heat shock protein 12B n=1 Tax=Mus musculus TaxID=10090 RepID=S4R176_MOUSE